MEETLDMQALWRAGKSVSEIARVTGRNLRTIRRLLNQGVPKPRVARLVNSKLDPFRDYLLQRLLQDKVTNAAVLFDEIRAQGYAGGRSVLREFLHPLRSLLEDRTTVRFQTPPVNILGVGHACHVEAAERFMLRGRSFLRSVQR